MASIVGDRQRFEAGLGTGKVILAEKQITQIRNTLTLGLQIYNAPYKYVNADPDMVAVQRESYSRLEFIDILYAGYDKLFVLDLSLTNVVYFKNDEKRYGGTANPRGCSDYERTEDRKKCQRRDLSV